MIVQLKSASQLKREIGQEYGELLDRHMGTLLRMAFTPGFRERIADFAGEPVPVERVLAVAIAHVRRGRRVNQWLYGHIRKILRNGDRHGHYCLTAKDVLERIAKRPRAADLLVHFRELLALLHDIDEEFQRLLAEHHRLSQPTLF